MDATGRGERIGGAAGERVSGRGTPQREVRGAFARWLRGVGETLGVIALFVGGGLVCGELIGGGLEGKRASADRVTAADAPIGRARRAGKGTASYAPGIMNPVADPEDPAASDPTDTNPAEPQRWLIDGFNVLHAGVLQGRDRRDWWKPAAQDRLIAIAKTFDDPAAELWVVFDDTREGSGARCRIPEEGSRVRIAHAPSADDWIVSEVRRAEAPGQIAVVTADRQVRDRCRHRGARIVSPLSFLARCNRAAYVSDA